MRKATSTAGRAALIGFILCGSTGAAAQVDWCCDNAAHAGGTAEERCAGNRQTFAKAEECAAHKAEHDRGTGHSSRCGDAVPLTRKGTADLSAPLRVAHHEHAEDLPGKADRPKRATP